MYKGKKNEVLVKTCITKNTGDATSTVLESIVSWKDAKTDYFEVAQNDLYDGGNYDIRISGVSTENKDSMQTALGKVKKHGESLGAICNVNCGIQTGCNAIKINNKIFGVFIISNEEKEGALYKEEAVNIIRPFFNTSDIYKYGTSINNEYWVIYSDERFDDIEKMPFLKKHFNEKGVREVLNNIREVKNGRRKYFQLQWARDRNIFMGEKIVCPQRSIDNRFGYNTSEWFGGSGMFFITLKEGVELNLKYILALLNSKLYYRWLYHRGKRKGEILELIAGPLSEIPIKRIAVPDQKPFIEIVDKILSIAKSGDYLENLAKKKEVEKYEEQIDKLIYKLYDLDPEEIKIIETN